MAPSPSRVDQSLTLVVLAMLIIGCFFVLQPFITALVWAAILCTTTWPLYWRVTARLRDRSGLAALVMVVLLALLMIAPFIVSIRQISAIGIITPPSAAIGFAAPGRAWFTRPKRRSLFRFDTE